jgi:hypothetical protein
MKTRIRILAAATVALLSASWTMATESSVLKVSVPFDFVVANQTLPSGEYRIEQDRYARTVRIYSDSHTVNAYCEPTLDYVKIGGELMFKRYGDQYFLKTIRTADGHGARFPESRSEKQAQVTALAGVSIGMPAGAL